MSTTAASLLASSRKPAKPRESYESSSDDSDSDAGSLAEEVDREVHDLNDDDDEPVAAAAAAEDEAVAASEDDDDDDEDELPAEEKMDIDPPESTKKTKKTAPAAAATPKRSVNGPMPLPREAMTRGSGIRLKPGQVMYDEVNDRAYVVCSTEAELDALVPLACLPPRTQPEWKHDKDNAASIEVKLSCTFTARRTTNGKEFGPQGTTPKYGEFQYQTWVALADGTAILPTTAQCETMMTNTLGSSLAKSQRTRLLGKHPNNIQACEEGRYKYMGGAVVAVVPWQKFHAHKPNGKEPAAAAAADRPSKKRKASEAQEPVQRTPQEQSMLNQLERELRALTQECRWKKNPATASLSKREGFARYEAALDNEKLYEKLAPGRIDRIEVLVGQHLTGAAELDAAQLDAVVALVRREKLRTFASFAPSAMPLRQGMREELEASEREARATKAGEEDNVDMTNDF